MAKRSASVLHESVAFDEPVVASDNQGGEEDGWQQQMVCRAGYTWLRGGETVLAGRLEGRQPVVVRVRRSSETEAIDTDWRMRDTRSGAVYNIRSIVPTDDRRWLDLTCESGVAV